MSLPPGPDGEGLSRSRYMYNLSFEFYTKGSYSYQDFAAIVGFSAILAVYIAIPSKFVGFLAEYCLGNLSQLYKNGIRQQISAESVYAGMTARGLMYTVLFDHLILPKDAEGGDKFLTGEEPKIKGQRLEDLILHMFKSGGRIDTPEEAKKVFGLLASEMDKNSDAELTRREFIDCALNSDLSSLRSVADNFDDDRKAPLCERMFKIGVKKVSQVTPESIVPV